MKVCEDVAEYKIHTGKTGPGSRRGRQDKLNVLEESGTWRASTALGAQELFQQIMAISRKTPVPASDQVMASETERNYEDGR